METAIERVGCYVKMGAFAFAANFDSAHETHEFVKCKIESLIANTASPKQHKEGKSHAFLFL